MRINSELSTIRERPNNKISIKQMGWVFEQLDAGVPFKSLAIDLGVHASSLRERHTLAMKNGFKAFVHPAHRGMA